MLRRDVYYPLFSVAPEIDRLLGGLFSESKNGENKSAAATGAPVISKGRQALLPLDVWESEDALHLEAELPGLSMENIEISVLGNELTLRVDEVKSDGEELKTPTGRVLLQERRARAASRTLQLPYEVDSEKAEAVLKNGVLFLKLPKIELAKPKKITVKETH